MSRAAAPSRAAGAPRDGAPPREAGGPRESAGAGRHGARSPSNGHGLGGYLRRSEWPLHSLAFLLPLIVLYEVGTRWYASDPIHQTEQRIIAFNLLQQFFHLVGATGRYVPALAVVGILLSWHIARNDPWRLSPWTLGGMLAESFILAGPLLLLSVAAAHYVPLQTGHGDWRSLLVLSVGAGIYEELIFRLIAFTLLSLFLMDILTLPKALSIGLMVVAPAILFALYHYLGNETPNLRSFVFRTAAGLYFGGVFVTRGFGITAGCHAAYDVFIVLFATAR